MKLRKKTVLISVVLAVLLVIGFVFAGLAIYGIYSFSDSLDYIEEVTVELPDSDITIKIKTWCWLAESGIRVFYVKDGFLFFPDSDEHLGYLYTPGFKVLDKPFSFEQDSNYEIVNHGDGSFTIKWEYYEKELEDKFYLPKE